MGEGASNNMVSVDRNYPGAGRDKHRPSRQNDFLQSWKSAR